LTSVPARLGYPPPRVPNNSFSASVTSAILVSLLEADAVLRRSERFQSALDSEHPDAWKVSAEPFQIVDIA
jgi:hypothetical protein